VIVLINLEKMYASSVIVQDILLVIAQKADVVDMDMAEMHILHLLLISHTLLQDATIEEMLILLHSIIIMIHTADADLDLQ
jgi:exosome complex RNA-binding protein Rrp42 (RNase PH superfamily)